ncbi:hypothetical protein FNH05_10060 [Amycolatopsis rhizosphaerae]|uniref:Uncharacterized protein n=1 Tax=Amycolatopsis rhizosphaerae TaxID=2053003 RepID=A0A558D1V4_9PSEU|nr:hypothetical protein [Amycolatopsis rhizosphaerae]TVT54943.1 hypothetical protein FNH05_10060 [Amycolatopsis rhizosphaerae]
MTGPEWQQQPFAQAPPDVRGAARPAWRRRKAVLLGGAGLVVALVAGLVVWVSVPNGSADPAGAAASASGAPPAEVGAAAADALQAWPAVQLTVSYQPGVYGEQDPPVTEADLTVTADGQAAGTLREPEAGSADAAWSGGQLYLQGDPEFWAQQDPQYADILTSAGRWVKPEKRSGYYMLDNFGVDAGTITPKALAELVRQVTSAPDVQRDGPWQTQDGHPATAYTARGWTVLIGDEAPHAVLALGGNPHASDGPVRPAAWRPAGPMVAGPAVYRPLQADDPDGNDTGPYVSMAPRQATQDKADATRSAVASASAEAVTDDGAGRLGGQRASSGPEFEINELTPSLCTSPTCTHTIEVTNSGAQAADATLYTNDPGDPGAPSPLGTLAPGQSKQVTFSHANLAPATGGTVNYTVNVWVYSSALYGPDPDVAERLRARGLQPDKQSELSSIDVPLRPAATRLLDAMTKDTPTSGSDAEKVNASALKALNSANRSGQLPLWEKIVDSGRLQNPGDLRRRVSDAGAPGQLGKRRQLEHLVHLLQTDPTARVWYDGNYTADDGKQYHADAIYTSTQDGKPVKRCVQVKALKSLGSLGSNVRDGAQQLNGQKTGSDENCPPGFERVLVIELEPSVGPAMMYGGIRPAVEAFLKGKKSQQARQNLCGPNRTSLVDRLVIVNAAGTHEWTDLGKTLGIPC